MLKMKKDFQQIERFFVYHKSFLVFIFVFFSENHIFMAYSSSSENFDF